MLPIFPGISWRKKKTFLNQFFAQNFSILILYTICSKKKKKLGKLFVGKVPANRLQGVKYVYVTSVRKSWKQKTAAFRGNIPKEFSYGNLYMYNRTSTHLLTDIRAAKSTRATDSKGGCQICLRGVLRLGFSKLGALAPPGGAVKVFYVQMPRSPQN